MNSVLETLINMASDGDFCTVYGSDARLVTVAEMLDAADIVNASEAV